MSNVIGRLVYMITGDTASLEANLDSSKKKVKELGAQIDKTGEKIKAFAKGTITATLVKSLIDAASRVEELESKFNTVFDGISSATDKWVRDYAEATSRGVTATKEFLATQQDLRTGYGDNTESAAEYSKAVVAITNDLASFSNIPVEQAMQSMQSGLNQQFEALRTLGVSLSVATLEQGEYAKSLGKTWEQMSALEKQEAILSGIVSQSKNALHQTITDWRDYNYLLGDAARTSGSFANTSQGLTQTLDDLKAELGNALLPVATDAAGLLTDLMKIFNALPEPIQVSTTAIAAFAATTALISGPIGIAVGAASALSIALGQAKSSQEKLQEATRSLNSANHRYQDITRQLAGDVDSLTESERALLKARQDIARSDATIAMGELAELYRKNAEDIKASDEAVIKSQARRDAAIVAKQGTGAIRQTLKELAGATDDYSIQMINSLSSWLIGYGTLQDTIDKEIEELSSAYESAKVDNAKLTADIEAGILSAAISFNSGILDIESYKDSHSELYNEIVRVANEIKAEGQEAGKTNDYIKSSSFISSEWTDALKEQRAEIAENNKSYEEAYAIRKELLAKEQEDAVRKLASDAGLIESGENLAKMDIETIRERLSANESTKNELIALDEYYSNQAIELEKEKNSAIEDLDNELAEKRRENAKEVLNLLDEQMKATKEQIASELENNGEYEKAYRIRQELLQQESNKAIMEMQRKVAEGTATNEEILNLEQYYAQRQVELETEKNRKIQEAREQSAEDTKSMLRSQETELKESAAAELEAIGQCEKATAIRIGLLRQERDEAISAMEEKIEKGLATEEELLRIKQYYANEESNLIDEQSEKMRNSLQDAIQTSLTTIGSFAGSVQGLFSAVTESRLAAIDKETQAQLEALGLQEETEREKLQNEYDEAVKNGDMELAQEKAREIERQRIEDEAEEKKARIQREAAEREKRFAIFQATIDMLSAMIGFMADPGSYAGIALSAMAAAQGAMQIAAIQAQPLPSYAVGAVDVSEDHIAQIHQGELIIPKTFAQGVRDGDISIGDASSSVSVTIINNTGAEASVERSDSEDKTKLIVTIGKIVDSQISKGRFDKSMESRYEITRRKTRG